ncbi:virulence factor Mce family protein [Mycolicibacterium rhodesiae JS60]|nr:virulence factor Mce family protein [Mycolicibacterium rhodesiae JS60]
MIGIRSARKLSAIAVVLVTSSTGCSFGGINSLPLPGTVGRGPGATTYHIELASVGTLESNSPVLIDDVVVGTVGPMRVRNWHAEVDVSVRPEVVVPANAIATVGQTSLLGSMHIALGPPLGEAPRGRLQPGSTISLAQSFSYPSTEQTLSTLSTVVNAGGLGQIGDVVRGFNIALAGHEVEARDVLSRLNEFVGVFDQQRGNVIASLKALDRLAGTLANQNSVLAATLQKLPPAIEVLNRERPRITTALAKLRTLSDSATSLVNDTQADLVRNLTNLGPTLQALADVGPDIDDALAFSTVYPFGQSIIDRGVRGDYMNLFVTIDLTRNRIKRTLALGTRWGDENSPFVPAPGDPGYEAYYTTNPLGVALDQPPSPPVHAPLPSGPEISLPPGSPAHQFPTGAGWG